MRYKARQYFLLIAFIFGISSVLANKIYSSALETSLYSNYSVLNADDAKAGLPEIVFDNYLEKLGATETFHRKETFAQGALIAGEAIALSLRIVLDSDDTTDWLNSKNAMILTSDLFVGSGLIYLTFQDSKLHTNKWYWLLTAISFATHLYRQYEYRLDIENAYCSNEGLYALTRIKLSATIASGTTGLILRFKMQL